MPIQTWLRLAPLNHKQGIVPYSIFNIHVSNSSILIQNNMEFLPISKTWMFINSSRSTIIPLNHPIHLAPLFHLPNLWSNFPRTFHTDNANSTTVSVDKIQSVWTFFLRKRVDNVFLYNSYPSETLHSFRTSIPPTSFVEALFPYVPNSHRRKCLS